MTELQELLVSFKAPSSNATNGHAAAALSHPSSERRNKWQKLIDEKLIEWGRHPEQFEDEDGYKAPTPENLIRATEFIAFCRERDVAPPLRMAPDGEGGIVFDWRTPQHIYLEIHAGGDMEVLVFENCNLIARQTIGARMPT